jgi:hypothetical protein
VGGLDSLMRLDAPRQKNKLAKETEIGKTNQRFRN